MFGYLTIGTNDIERAVEFYDALLGEIGAQRNAKWDTGATWSTGPGSLRLMVAKPFDGKPATAGNGSMLAIAVDGPEKVDALHAKALELGGADEGAPGPRGTRGFYAGYFRDPDGNKLNVHCAPGS
jgi:catechol 2,3-dioxygenase-like lactoylglutathione lyase family enzyme